MKLYSNSLFLLLILTIGSLFFLSQCSNSETSDDSEATGTTLQQKGEQPELAELMSQLQRYTHKFTLSVHAENRELATFYFDEAEALTKMIKKETPGYEGYDIARFMELFLDPALTEVDQALKEAELVELRTKTIEMIEACNSCHRATSHGFVEITPAWENNPFNQSFSSN